MQTETTVASTGTPTETVSAERIAAESGDFGALQQASRDRRTGKPPANVERPKAEPSADKGTDRTVPGKEGVAAKGPSDKDREADERLATRIREAVDTSTAEVRKKNSELEAQLAALRRGATSDKSSGVTGDAKADKATERRALTSADLRAYQALPGAPKLDDRDATGAFVYETAQEHAIALGEFVREARESERATAAKTSTDRVERVKQEAARVTTFAGRIEAFKQANPDRLVDGPKGAKTALPLSPEVGGLHGFAKLHEINTDRTSKGLAPIATTVDHAIAEELYDSAMPSECALYLSEHPEAFAALRSCQSPAALTRAFGALEERVTASIKTPAAAASGAATTVKDTAADTRRKAEDAVDRSVSSAKPLNGTLGRPGTADADPQQTAIAKGDYGMFAETQRARRLEQLQSRGKR